METKFTPGPWAKSTENNTVFAYSEEEPVAWISGYSNKEEQSANAKLIAAAPVLLEALSKALETIGLLQHEANFYSSRWISEHITPLKNVIAKATE